MREEGRHKQLPDEQYMNEVWQDTCRTKLNEVPNIDTIDDELGFDPFEETNKALAEDIAMENQLREEEEQRQQLKQQQQQQQQSYQQLQQRQQQQHQQQQLQQQQLQLADHTQSIRNEIKGFLGNNSISASRLPPPGFNGISLSSFSNSLQQQHQQQSVDVNKLLPSFMSGLNSSLGNLSSTAPQQQLNGVTRIGTGIPPPGLSLLNTLQSQMPGGIGGMEGSIGGGGGNNSSQLLASLDPSLPAPPPGLSLPKHDPPLVMKDLENGVRNMFSGLPLNNSLNALNVLQQSTGNVGLNFNNSSSINSFSNINGITPLAVSLANINTNSVNNASNISFGALNSQQNTLSALNSLTSFGGLNLASGQQQNSSSNTLSNLFGLKNPHQHQQQQIQQQQQQQQQLPQQSLLHQITVHNAQKGKVSFNWPLC